MPQVFGWVLKGASRYRALSWILLLAISLRIAALPWGIRLGASDGFYHPDESKVWSTILEFPGNLFTSTNFLYGTTLQYTIATLIYPFRFLWTMVEPSPAELSQQQFVILCSRFVSCCLGAGAVGMTYRLGRQLCNERTGLIAALLLCVSFYHCLNSALTTLDVAMSFFATTCIVLAWQATRSGRLSDFVLLGVAAAYLIGAKISGGMFLVFFVSLTWEFYSTWRGRKPIESLPLGDDESMATQNRLDLKPFEQPKTSATGTEDVNAVPAWIPVGNWIQGMLLAGGIAGIILMISMPHILLQPKSYLRFMASQQHLWFDRADHSLVGITRSWATSLGTALNPLSFYLGLLGLFLASFKISASTRPLHWGLFAVLVCHVVFWRGYVSARFVIVLAPLFSVYAAYSLDWLFRQTNRGCQRVATILLLATMTEGMVICLAGLYDRYHDSRTVSAVFLTRELNDKDRIALLPLTELDPQSHAWKYPRISRSEFHRVSITDNPDILVTSSYVTEILNKAIQSSDLPADYVWPRERLAFWPKYLAPAPSELRFAEKLLQGTSEYEHIRTWKTSSLFVPEFGSPDIHFYRRKRTFQK